MEEAIKINNDGVRHFMNRRFDEAEQCYEEALRMNPESATVLNNMGLLYHQRKQFDKAVSYFEMALNIEEKDTYYVNAGNAMASMKQFGQAEEQYIRALELNSKSIKAAESLANMYEYQGKTTEASTYWSKLVSETGDAKYYFLYARNLIKQEKFREALDILYNYSSREQSATWYMIGICEYQLRNFGSAADALKQALAIDPDSEEIRHYLSVVYLASGQTGDAIMQLDKLINISPQNHHFLTEKGVILLSRNMIKEALELFEKSLIIDPGFQKALKYRDMALKLLEDSGEN